MDKKQIAIEFLSPLFAVLVILLVFYAINVMNSGLYEQLVTSYCPTIDIIMLIIITITMLIAISYLIRIKK